MGTRVAPEERVSAPPVPMFHIAEPHAEVAGAEVHLYLCSARPTYR